VRAELQRRKSAGQTNRCTLRPLHQKFPSFSLALTSPSTSLPTTPKMPFAQLVIGPPGSGKSTYCDGMQQFMGAIDRKCSVVNLDPANDHTSYQPALDVRDLVTIDEIMEQETLGPNGGVLFALEELEHNFDWLEEGLKELGGLQRHIKTHGKTC
jgi:GTPase SAR1 family protein